MLADLLILITAPLHGAGVPRLPLRRLGGRSLLEHTAQTALTLVARREQIAVVTDDDEVALAAERLGLSVHVAQDPDGTPALAAAASALAARAGVVTPETVLVTRAAAPLTRAADLLAAVEQAQRAPHGVRSATPNGEATDAFLVMAFGHLAQASASAGAHHLMALPADRGVVVRSTHDWWVVERLFHRRRITCVVIGDPAVGLGHVYRAALIAHELADHDVTFVCPRDHALAAELLSAQGLPVERAATHDLAAAVLATSPDLVINDILNTEIDYVMTLKSRGVKVVNFEDLGPGALAADLVINDIFLETAAPPNHRNGPAYFCIRDEFLSAPRRPVGAPLEEVLITFGGTDPADSTARVARLIVPDALARGLRVSIVTGAGYLHLDRLREQLAAWPSDALELAAGTRRMSEYMSRADVAFSSAGRTVFELAAMRVPAIILAANPREETHTFAAEANGFLYLGRADQVADDAIVAAWRRISGDEAVRGEMRARMVQWDFRDGRARVLAELAALLADTADGSVTTSPSGKDRTHGQND